MQLCYSKDSRNIAALKLRAVAALADVPLDVRYRNDTHHSTEAGAGIAFREATQMRDDAHSGGGASGITFQTENGITYDTLFETNAIFRYLARLDEYKSHHLYGRTPVEASQVDMWIDFAAREIDDTQQLLARACTSQPPSCGDQTSQELTEANDQIMAKVDNVLRSLEDVLLIRTYLVGERLTIADVAVAFSIHGLIQDSSALDARIKRNLRSVFRHYNTVMMHPKVRPIIKKEGFTV